MIKDFDLVLGSFRLKDAEHINKFLSQIPGKKVLIDTGVSYNVDHVISKINPDNTFIMSKFGVDHLDEFDNYLENHLRYLNRSVLDYALVHFYEPGWDELVHELKNDKRILNVGVSNFNIDQLNDYYDVFHEWPCVNEIEFSIMYHDAELVEFCYKHGIEVLGYGVLGGIHACKQAIRQYTVTDLLNFAVHHGVTPIVRSDFYDHIEKDYDIIRKCREGKIIGRSSIADNDFEYSLTESNTDPRALNKFRYDRPKHALKVKYNDQIIYTLDESFNVGIGTDTEVVDVNSVSIEDLGKAGYSELFRDYMMVTDYLVADKFQRALEDKMIKAGDDFMMYFTESEGISVVMKSVVDGSLIKSGSEGARVFFKTFKL